MREASKCLIESKHCCAVLSVCELPGGKQDDVVFDGPVANIITRPES